jgi:hypothetical protein
MKKLDVRQLELGCDEEHALDVISVPRRSDQELMRRIDKVISETTRSVRPALNRMVKDVERLLEGSFIRTPDGSNVLDDMVEGLEIDIRKFVDEVKALKRWSQSNPSRSPSNKLRD